MKPISDRVYGLLNSGRGIESVMILAIDWGGGGYPRWYSTKLVLNSEADHVDPRIMRIDSFDSQISVSNGETSEEITIVLDDSDGVLKDLFDTTDLHNKPIELYQWFEGTLWSDKISVFQGVVNTPVAWNESDRTLTVTMMSRIEDVEVGFSFESAAINWHRSDPEELYGRTVPECFGTITYQPAIALDRGFIGADAASTQSAIILADFTIPYLLRAMKRMAAYANALANFWHGQVSYSQWQCYALCEGDSVPGEYQSRLMGGHFGRYSWSTRIMPSVKIEGAALKWAAALDVYYKAVAEIKQIEKIYEQQLAAEAASRTVKIFGGEGIPDGPVYVDGIDINGTNSGGTLRHNWVHPAREEYAEGSKSLPRYRFPVDNVIGKEDDGYTSNGIIEQMFACECTTKQDDNSDGGITGETAGYAEISAGSEVAPAVVQRIRHAVSVTPGTVLNVRAHTDRGGKSQYPVPVPSSNWRQFTLNLGNTRIYSVQQHDTWKKIQVGGNAGSTKRHGSSQSGTRFEDEIWVSYRSTIGPNPVDIMSYLIKKYTKFGIDRESFARVRLNLQQYRMDFCTPERKNIIQALKEIAFQARCAIYLKDGKFFLHYMPDAPRHAFEFNENTVLENSVAVEYMNTEDVVTKWTGKYYPARSSNRDHWQYILRYNIDKYGTHEETTDFYTYASLSSLKKAMAYWMMRKCYVWKILKCKGSLDLLGAEVYDGALINFKEALVANDPVLGLITRADYNPFDYTIDFEIWTGVRAGDMSQFDWAFPAGVSVQIIYPPLDENPRPPKLSNDAPAIPNAQPTNFESLASLVPTCDESKSGYYFFTGRSCRYSIKTIKWEVVGSNRDDKDEDEEHDEDKPNDEPENPGDEGEPTRGSPTDDPWPGGDAQWSPDQSMEFKQPKQLDGKESMDSYIDIRTSYVYDSGTGGLTTFSTFFSAVLGGKLIGATGAEWSDGGNQAPFYFKFDGDSGQFAAGLAYLKD